MPELTKEQEKQVASDINLFKMNYKHVFDAFQVYGYEFCYPAIQLLYKQRPGYDESTTQFFLREIEKYKARASKHAAQLSKESNERHDRENDLRQNQVQITKEWLVEQLDVQRKAGRAAEKAGRKLKDGEITEVTHKNGDVIAKYYE